MRVETLTRWCQHAIEGGWLLLALALPLTVAPGGVYPFEPAKIALLRTVVAGMAGLWLLHALLARRPLPLRRLARQPIAILAALLVVLYAAATACSIAPATSLWGGYQWRQGTLTFLALLALFALVADGARAPAQRARLVSAILLASGLVCAYGLLQVAGLDPVPWNRPGDRAFATVGHPNFLGLYVAMTMPLAVTRLLTARGWPRRAIYAVLLALQAAGLLATFSRSAWAGAAVGGAVFWLLMGWRRRWMLAGLGTTALVVALLAGLGVGPLAPVCNLLRGQSATAAIRVIEWEAVLRLVAARPLLGAGPETLNWALQAVYPPALTAYGGIGATGGRAHNEALDWAASVGVIGLAAYLGLVLVACWRGWRAAGDARPLAAALIAGVAAYLAANQFSFGAATTLGLLWTSLGLLAGDLGGWQLETSEVCQDLARWQVLAGVGLVSLAVAGAGVVNLAPLLADEHARAGLAAVTRSDWPAAIAAYERAIAWQPPQDRAHALLAQAHLARAVTGDPASFARAEAAQEQALRLAPIDEAHWLELGDVRRYWWATAGDAILLDRAAAAYEQARRLSPTDPEPLVRRGQVEAARGRPAAAVAWYQAAIDLDPLNVTAYTCLALAYESLGRSAKAATARQQAAQAAAAIDRLIAQR